MASSRNTRQPADAAAGRSPRRTRVGGGAATCAGGGGAAATSAGGGDGNWSSIWMPGGGGTMVASAAGAGSDRVAVLEMGLQGVGVDGDRVPARAGVVADRHPSGIAVAGALRLRRLQRAGSAGPRDAT